MPEPARAQVRAADEILKLPSTKDLEAVRARRYQVAEILNTNLLAPDSRQRYESLYAETGAVLENAADAAEK